MIDLDALMLEIERARWAMRRGNNFAAFRHIDIALKLIRAERKPDPLAAFERATAGEQP